MFAKTLVATRAVRACRASRALFRSSFARQRMNTMIRSSPLFSRPIRPSALRFADSGPLCALWLGEASAEAVACPSGSLPPPFREIRSAYLSLSLTASRPPSHPQAARVQTRAAVDFYGPDRAKYVSTSHAVGPARPLTRSLARPLTRSLTRATLPSRPTPQVPRTLHPGGLVPHRRVPG